VFRLLGSKRFATVRRKFGISGFAFGGLYENSNKIFDVFVNSAIERLGSEIWHAVKAFVTKFNAVNRRERKVSSRLAQHLFAISRLQKRSLFSKTLWPTSVEMTRGVLIRPSPPTFVD
jgi:hypothetical protein